MIRKETGIVERFRQLLGTKNETGYYTPVDALQVPNFIGTDHPMEVPQIIIRPYITDKKLEEMDVYVDDGRYQSVLGEARFQVDIYTRSFAELINIRQAIEERLDDFINLELFAFCGVEWDEPPVNGIYFSEDYNDEYNIVRMTDQLGVLTRVYDLQEVTSGKWYIDENGIYVFPLIDLEGLILYQEINGQIFPDGLTTYDAGISTIEVVSSRKMKDKEPELERWVMELRIVYRIERSKRLGQKITGMDMNVQEN